MCTDQISVFLENRPGRLSYVCRLLSDNGVDIRAVNIAENKDFGILRLIVDDCEKALGVLKNASVSAESTKVVTVEILDVPGGLATVLEAVEKANLNIEYMYGFAERHSDYALMVFRFEDPEKAAAALADAGICVVSKK